VLVFSGLTWEELQRVPGIEHFLGLIDVLIAGRYDQTRRIAGGLIGSNNKTVHYLTDRYTTEDLAHVPQAEVIVDTNGEIRLSGIDPLEW
jgi:anaerobic ribonucleoside-triphosphate reductase activating protein